MHKLNINELIYLTAKILPSYQIEPICRHGDQSTDITHQCRQDILTASPKAVLGLDPNTEITDHMVIEKNVTHLFEILKTEPQAFLQLNTLQLATMVHLLATYADFGLEDHTTVHDIKKNIDAIMTNMIKMVPLLLGTNKRLTHEKSWIKENSYPNAQPRGIQNRNTFYMEAIKIVLQDCAENLPLGAQSEHEDTLEPVENATETPLHQRRQNDETADTRPPLLQNALAFCTSVLQNITTNPWAQKKIDTTNSMQCQQHNGPVKLLEILKTIASIPADVFLRIFREDDPQSIYSLCLNPTNESIAQWAHDIEHKTKGKEELNAMIHMTIKTLGVLTSLLNTSPRADWSNSQLMFSLIEKNSPIRQATSALPQDWIGLATRIIKTENIATLLNHCIQKIQLETGRDWNTWLPEKRPLQTLIKQNIPTILSKILEIYTSIEHLQDETHYCELASTLDTLYPVGTTLSPSLEGVYSWSDIFGVASCHSFINAIVNTHLIDEICDSVNVECVNKKQLTLSLPISSDSIVSALAALTQVSQTLVNESNRNAVEKVIYKPIKTYITPILDNARQNSTTGSGLTPIGEAPLPDEKLNASMILAAQKIPYVLQNILAATQAVIGTVNLMPSTLRYLHNPRQQYKNLASGAQAFAFSWWNFSRTCANNAKDLTLFCQSAFYILLSLGISKKNTRTVHVAMWASMLLLLSSIMYTDIHNIHPELLLATCLIAQGSLIHQHRKHNHKTEVPFLIFQTAPLLYIMYRSCTISHQWLLPAAKKILPAYLHVNKLMGYTFLLNLSPQQSTIRSLGINSFLTMSTLAMGTEISQGLIVHLVANHTPDLCVDACGLTAMYLMSNRFLDAQSKKIDTIINEKSWEEYYNDVCVSRQNHGHFVINCDLKNTTLVPSLSFATQQQTRNMTTTEPTVSTGHSYEAPTYASF